MSLPNAVWSTIRSDMHAVTALLHNGCTTHALSLVFISIDKMAWLSSAKVDHDRNDFIAWVEKYFLPGYPIQLNALDLYAARCGLLHTGSAESKLFRDGKAKQIFYSTGARRSDAEVEAEIHAKLPKLGLTPDEVVVLQCIDLTDQWSTAMERFTQAIEADSALQAHTKQRADLQLAMFPAG
ncbi:hypothetical protein [Pseudomonas putida]|uniref:hypothetical protein n=1 Tax=Pseudomonas putida TaxID=303 RepID=UPI0003818298|nr:hypothetical protein [Pseudomonas putida]